MHNDIEIIEQKDRKVIQSYFKLKHNNNNYTFVDYIYADTHEPVECGEFGSIFDASGNIVLDATLKETFGVFADQTRI